MVNTKAAVLLIVAAVLVAAVAGIAFAQYASAQANAARAYATRSSKVPVEPIIKIRSKDTILKGQQYGSSYGYGGMGMGMCGRFW